MNFWQKQDTTPHFKNYDFDKPEQKSLAGTFAVIGGNRGSFRAVASCATKAEQIGVSELHIVLPDSLKKTVPITVPNITFAESEPSGGFGKASENILTATINHSDATLLIGDFGKNAETTAVVASVVKTTTQPMLLTRDSLDLINAEATTWIKRQGLTLLASLSQLQKLLRTIYYPRVITLSQPTNQLVETLHKLTISYPNLTLATVHNDQYITAGSGEVITTPLADTNYSPLSVWQGDLATRISIYNIRQPSVPLASATTAILS